MSEERRDERTLPLDPDTLGWLAQIRALDAAGNTGGVPLRWQISELLSIIDRLQAGQPLPTPEEEHALSQQLSAAHERLDAALREVFAIDAELATVVRNRLMDVLLADGAYRAAQANARRRAG